MKTVYSRKEVRTAGVISRWMTSTPPYHSTSATAYWPVMPIAPAKLPYASARRAPSAYAACTAESYRPHSRGSIANERTVRTAEKTSCAAPLASASRDWYRFASFLMNLA